VALERADEDYWSFSANTTEWCVSSFLEALESKPLLHLPVALALSKYAPWAVMQESMYKLKKLLPNSSLVHIDSSRTWWELENPADVVEELLELIRRVTSHS